MLVSPSHAPTSGHCCCDCMQAYARLRTDCPELVDVGAVVMRGGQEEDGADMIIDGAAPDGQQQQQQQSSAPRQAKRRRIYQEHMPMSEVTAGIKAGRLHQVQTVCSHGPLPRTGPGVDPCLSTCHASSSDCSFPPRLNKPHVLVSQSTGNKSFSAWVRKAMCVPSFRCLTLHFWPLAYAIAS